MDLDSTMDWTSRSRRGVVVLTVVGEEVNILSTAGAGGVSWVDLRFWSGTGRSSRARERDFVTRMGGECLVVSIDRGTIGGTVLFSS